MQNTLRYLADPAPIYFKDGRCLKLVGQPYKAPEHSVHGGRGNGINIQSSSSSVLPPKFVASDFNGEQFTVRLATDPDLSLEVNYRKMEANNGCSLWFIDGHREWAVRWVLNNDGTLSPAQNKSVVLGEQDGKPILVSSQSPQRLIIEHAADVVAKLTKELAVAAEAAAAKIKAYLTPQFCESLMIKGFAHLKGAITAPVIARALREINRQLGGHTESGNKEKVTLSSRPEITGLYNDTFVPALMTRLLGPLPIGVTYSQQVAQIALRFPGDMCPNNDPEAFNQTYFDGLRTHWHIDGLANNAVKGMTDHFGTIRNFDCLVGVLLADVDEKNSGELCVYPGSHLNLSDYFKKDGVMQKLQTEGLSAMPMGAATNQLIGSEVYHCLGKAGDIFLANYNTAHFVNANISPNIRYAVYFRVKGPAFGSDIHCVNAMLDPLANWNFNH